MKLMEEERNRTNEEIEGASSTKTDDLVAVSSGSQPVVMQETLVKDIPTSILSVAHRALAQALKVPGDVAVSKNCRNDEFVRMKEKRDCLLEEET